MIPLLSIALVMSAMLNLFLLFRDRPEPPVLPDELMFLRKKFEKFRMLEKEEIMRLFWAIEAKEKG